MPKMGVGFNKETKKYTLSDLEPLNDPNIF